MATHGFWLTITIFNTPTAKLLSFKRFTTLYDVRFHFWLPKIQSVRQFLSQLNVWLMCQIHHAPSTRHLFVWPHLHIGVLQPVITSCIQIQPLYWVTHSVMLWWICCVWRCWFSVFTGCLLFTWSFLISFLRSASYFSFWFALAALWSCRNKHSKKIIYY